MESFYAIVYCQIRAVADEKVSLGLLLRSGNNVTFKYSHDKLTIIKELLPDPAYRLLKAGLRNMEDFFVDYKESNSQSLQENSLFGDLLGKSVEPPRFTNASYISYLNTYASNLLTFSKPFMLSVNPIDDDTYNILYQKFIYESDQIIEHGTTIYERVKKKVNPAIRSYVNLDIELTSEELQNLVVPTRVWFIGQNKVDVTGEIFDFEKKTYFLENEITKHLNLIHTLQEKPGTKGSGTHFLVGKEPPKKLRVNHSIWNNIRNLKYVRFIPTAELDSINEYIIKHRVSPFIKKSEPDEPVADHLF
jgi:hypothetical protein